MSQQSTPGQQPASPDPSGAPPAGGNGRPEPGWSTSASPNGSATTSADEISTPGTRDGRDTGGVRAQDVPSAGPAIGPTAQPGGSYGGPDTGSSPSVAPGGGSSQPAAAPTVAGWPGAAGGASGSSDVHGDARGGTAAGGGRPAAPGGTGYGAAAQGGGVGWHGGTPAGHGGSGPAGQRGAAPVGQGASTPGRSDAMSQGGAVGQGAGQGGAADGERARAALNRLRAEVGKVVVGQDPAVTGLVIALLCQGHVLLEGVPGVAKTLMVRALSASLALETKRVQFTPDLMPGDVTGSLVYDARTAEFSFRPGPVFTNLLLADEINRTPPKTQASLLEAMEERQVSVEGEPRPLPDPFIVVATQNPIEYEGTYPLPEAQLDRFLLKLTVPLPSRDEEFRVLNNHHRGFDPRDLRRGRRDPGGRRRRSRRRAGRGARGAGRRRGPRATWSTCAGRPGSRRRCRSAPPRAGPPRCWPRRRRGPGCPAGTTSPRTTSRRWPGRRCGTGCRPARGRVGGRHRGRRAGQRSRLGAGARW